MSTIRMPATGAIARMAVAAAVLGSASAQAYLLPPVPDQPGEWYVYYDADGARVGRASMDCDGNLGGSGTATEYYITGLIDCP
jgi:hypothetical protein